MSATVEWFCIEPGVYRGRYQGKLLEILRNGDIRDKRRYVCTVDGEPVAQPCWTIPQAKTKLIKYITRNQAGIDRTELEPLVDPLGGSGSPANRESQAVVPYEAPPPPPADASVEMTYVITGTMRVADFGAGWNHLTATIDMLREWGTADGEAIPPVKVRF